MKVMYAACDVSKTGVSFAEKLVRVYLPSVRVLGRLVKRHKGSQKCSVEIYRGERKLRISFSNHTQHPQAARITGIYLWMQQPVESVYLPVKEMLSHAPGFRSLYAQREIHFSEVYADILDRAYRPPLRGPIDSQRKKLLSNLQKILQGKVVVKEEEFFLRSRQGNLEFSLLAEGMRKLGLLWLLIQNGTLLKGSVLFWDEPEANLNPKLFGPLVEILRMKAVDFLIEEPHRTFFLEFKDAEHPAAPLERRREFLQRMLSGSLDEDLIQKYRDSFLYWWAEGNEEKPVYFFVLIASEQLDEAMLLTCTERLKRKLPCAEGAPAHWQRFFAHGCGVFHITTWNRHFQRYPVSRVTR